MFDIDRLFYYILFTVVSQTCVTTAEVYYIVEEDDTPLWAKILSGIASIVIIGLIIGACCYCCSRGRTQTMIVPVARYPPPGSKQAQGPYPGYPSQPPESKGPYPGYPSQPPESKGPYPGYPSESQQLQGPPSAQYNK